MINQLQGRKVTQLKPCPRWTSVGISPCWDNKIWHMGDRKKAWILAMSCQAACTPLQLRLAWKCDWGAQRFLFPLIVSACSRESGLRKQAQNAWQRRAFPAPPAHPRAPAALLLLHKVQALFVTQDRTPRVAPECPHPVCRCWTGCHPACHIPAVPQPWQETETEMPGRLCPMALTLTAPTSTNLILTFQLVPHYREGGISPTRLF